MGVLPIGMFIWTLFGTHDVPTQLWVSRDLDKQGNFVNVTMESGNSELLIVFEKRTLVPDVTPELSILRHQRFLIIETET